MTRSLGFPVKFALFVALAAFTLASPADAAKLKLGHPGALDHHYQKGALMFKKMVEERSKGDLEIVVFPSNQLGKQRESVEGAQLGTVDMVLTSDVLLSSFEVTMGVLNLPFLFDGYDHLAKVLDGPIGEELSKNLEKKGLTVLSYWENGFRHITNSKTPINKPEDLKGLKIRTPSGAVFVDAFNTFGASATPIAFGELYTALQVKVVDGQENPVAHVLTQKFYEVQNYLSLTNHIHVAEPLVMSSMIYEGLSDGQKAILKQAAKDVAGWMRKEVVNAEAEQLKALEGKVAINKADVEAFEKASQPVYDKYKSKFGDLITRIKAAR